MAAEEPIRNRVKLALAYDAALRQEKLCSMRTDDVDPAHRTLRVRAQTTKNRLERVVPHSSWRLQPAQGGYARPGQIIEIGSAAGHCHGQGDRRSADHRACSDGEGAVGRFETEPLDHAPARNREVAAGVEVGNFGSGFARRFAQHLQWSSAWTTTSSSHAAVCPAADRPHRLTDGAPFGRSGRSRDRLLANVCACSTRGSRHDRMISWVEEFDCAAACFDVRES
ncbi:tyrosine-type recombinase/integrase [Nocardia sp. NPDC051990]|uniref:tyrosine-type recombinase/integrase n=1 Tax=Nocardia sp. NPDC051990 TaxID=3155285 RepID=UPI003436134A